MASLYGTQFTDQWLQNPWGMTQADQLSNQFSKFNNKPFPFPPTYNTDAAAGGGPTDAMGRPIRSFQDWQAANPGGTTINNTQAQAQQTQQQGQQQGQQLNWLGQAAVNAGGTAGAPLNQNPYASASANPAGSSQADLVARYYQQHPETNPDPYAAWPADANMRQYITNQSLNSQGNPATLNQGGFGSGNTVASNTQAMQDRSNATMLDQMNRQAQYAPAATAAPQQTNAAPNNWQAAINALANPGNPKTPGATVAPVTTGYQPAGGVNNAFLQQAQGQSNMNQGFLSALQAIQGRRQT